MVILYQIWNEVFGSIFFLNYLLIYRKHLQTCSIFLHRYGWKIPKKSIICSILAKWCSRVIFIFLRQGALIFGIMSKHTFRSIITVFLNHKPYLQWHKLTKWFLFASMLIIIQILFRFSPCLSLQLCPFNKR